MTIPYPNDYFGPIGEVECCECGIKLSLDDEAIQDEWDYQIYCEDCHKELLKDRQEEEEDE